MEVYIVKISDIDEENLNKYSLLISSEKRDKIKRYISKKDKIRSLIGEILVRVFIIRKFNIDNKTIMFSKNQYNKPYLDGYPNVHFNISHSADYVVCAIDEKAIGIDIEEIKPMKYDEIVKSYFDILEAEYILNPNVNNQLEKFYEIWTIKESYVKCIGEGLTIPLNTFSIQINENDKNEAKVYIKNKYTKYRIKVFDTKSNYKIAICSSNNDISEEIIEVEQESLISQYLELNVSKIAKDLNGNKSTISREIKRNIVNGKYSAHIAQDNYEARRIK